MNRRLRGWSVAMFSIAASAWAQPPAGAVGVPPEPNPAPAINAPQAPPSVQDRRAPPPPPKAPANGAVAAAKPASPTNSKAIFDDLIQGGRTAGPPAGGAPDTGKVVEEILDVEKLRLAESQREGMLAYQQALAAGQANRPIEALRLAKRAKASFPTHPEIAAYVASLQMEANSTRALTAASIKAKAYLAAGFARGQELMRAGRYLEAEDLLSAVLEATQLFPDPTSVEIYRRLADQELEQYRLNVRTGAIAADSGSAQTQFDPPRMTVPGVAAPDNFRRLLRSAEARTPSWYSYHKNRLATPVSVDYKRTPLASVLDEMAEKTGLTFVLDVPVVLARTHINSLLDMRIRDMSAETILDLACQKAGVEYVIMERSVVVTTYSKALEYVKQWPEALRHNWALGRVLFPELHPELYAAPPGGVTTPTGPATFAGAVRDADVRTPAHLRSGRALVFAIQTTLK